MRKGFLASVAALAAGAGLSFGQAPQAPAASDPVAVSATGQPIFDPAVMPVVGGTPVFYQGAAGANDYAPGMHRHGLFGGHGGDDGCGQGCGTGCDPNAYQIHKAAGGPDCFYFDLDLLYYYFRSMPIAAPLLTTGPIGSSGRLGEDGVRVLVGDKNIDYGPQSALRLTLGFWDRDRKWGIEGIGFITEQRAEVDNFLAPVTGRSVLARPIFNVLTGVQDSILASSPPVFGGAANVYTNARAGGAELNFLRSCAYYDKFKLNALVGFRWMSLNEKLDVSTHAEPAFDTIRDIFDSFVTRNNFYGGQIGLQNEFRRGRWFADQTAKIAVGFTHEKLNQSGLTNFTDFGVTTSVPYGALVLEPNSGQFSDKRFSVVGEYNLKLGFQWTQRLSTYIGYDIVYLSRALRPGDQVNPNVNPTLLPISNVYNPQFPFGPPQPSLKLENSDFFMQGFQFGLSYRY